MNLEGRLDRLERNMPSADDQQWCTCEGPRLSISWTEVALDSDGQPLPEEPGGERIEVCEACGKPYRVRVITWDEVCGGGVASMGDKGGEAW